MPKYAYRTPDGEEHGRFSGGYNLQAVTNMVLKEAVRQKWGPGEVVLHADKPQPATQARSIHVYQEGGLKTGK